MLIGTTLQIFWFLCENKKLLLFQQAFRKKNNDYYIAISGIPILTISRHCFVSIHIEKRQKTRGFQEV